MGKVIGYKGTQEDRLSSWNSMLLLRNYLDTYKTTEYIGLPSDIERATYQHLFKEYTDVRTSRATH